MFNQKDKNDFFAVFIGIVIFGPFGIFLAHFGYLESPLSQFFFWTFAFAGGVGIWFWLDRRKKDV